MAACVDCKLWAESKKGEAGWRMGMGKCTNVPKFFDATEDVIAFDPEDYECGARTLKSDFTGTKAMVLDGSGYRAELITAPDFGCVDFDSRFEQRE